MASLSSNRLRHIARRLFEVPPAFLAERVWMGARRMLAWPRFAMARRGYRAPHAPPFSQQFAEVSTALHDAVVATAASDAAYRDLIRVRTEWITRDKRTPCLGHGFLPLPEGSSWRADPVGGFTWPLSYFPFINFLTHGRNADVKVPWELSRMQWLVWLAEAAAAHPAPEERRKAAEQMARSLDDWQRHNPFGYGPNWTIAMEVAIRAINIGLATALAGDALSDDRRANVRSLLYEHLLYLRDFPEISDKPGNHQLVGLCGRMFLEAVVFGTATPDAIQRWSADAAEQFEPDGLHIEHAPTYHRLCTEAVLWMGAWAARQRNGAPDNLRALIGQCCRALGILEMRSGLPVIGDSDSGQIVSEGEASRSVHYLRQLLGFEPGAAPLMAAAAGSGESLDGAAPLKKGARRPVYDRVGPFLRLTDGEIDVTLRAGPHGLYGRASHDHDDNGAPWVAFGDDDLLVEAGCYTYTRSFAQRAVDLASASHNLVTVDSRLRYALAAGSISPTVVHAPISTVEHDPTAAHVVVLHTRWEDHSGGAVHHTRRITVSHLGTPALEVVDTLALERPAPMALRWHFAPAWRLTPEADGRIRATIAGNSRAVHGAIRNDEPTSSLDIALEEYRHASLYGSEERATAVTVAVKPALTARIRSTFWASRVAP